MPVSFAGASNRSPCYEAVVLKGRWNPDAALLDGSSVLFMSTVGGGGLVSGGYYGDVRVTRRIRLNSNKQ